MLRLEAMFTIVNSGLQSLEDGKLKMSSLHVIPQQILNHDHSQDLAFVFYIASIRYAFSVCSIP